MEVGIRVGGTVGVEVGVGVALGIVGVGVAEAITYSTIGIIAEGVAVGIGVLLCVQLAQRKIRKMLRGTWSLCIIALPPFRSTQMTNHFLNRALSVSAGVLRTSNSRALVD